MGYAYGSKQTSLNGVWVYIQNKGYIVETKDPNVLASRISKLMREYLKENNLKVVDNGSYFAQDRNAETIQQDFKAFKKWLKKKFETAEN